MSTTSNWVSIPKLSRQPSQRLFCFPYAGGAASIYRGWANKLPPDIGVYPVQLPGHGNRLGEAPFKRIEPLVEAAAAALLPYFEGSFAFFGHSMGAIISFELARLLRREHKPTPAHLFLSGRAAPHKRKKEYLSYNLPEPEFIEELRRLKGTPQEVLEHPELMDMLSPILRADFEICETYRHLPEPPLDCPITAFSGLLDQDVSREQIEGWREYTSSSFTLRMFPGDHFFLHDSAPPMLQTMAQAMRDMT
ncbi:MAG: alpha/beta fold hydrolase [Acidobacteria bacterium]|nr:alpha/beta fold hydrolase [Acidobacteriota bacterium]